MRRVEIYDRRADNEGLGDIVRRVADLIDEGYTSGYYPYWEIVDDGNNNDDEAEE